MRFRKVLFVIPDLKGFYPMNYPHPGIGYLCEFLGQNGVECAVADMNLGYNYSDVKQRIEDIRPDLVGLTLFSFHYKLPYELTAMLKRDFDIPVILGGPHVCITKGDILRETVADFAIRSEGEYPLLALCRGEPLENIGSLIYRSKGEILENKPASFIRHLDEIPWPKYRAFELDKYPNKLSMDLVTSRGCPEFCTFCSVALTMGRTFRIRSVEGVIEEIKYWYDRGRRSFNFCDDSFAQGPKRLMQLCDLIEQQGWKDVSFNCSQGLRADKVSRALLTRMKEVGFKEVGFGVESTSNRTLEDIRKGETIEQIEEAVKIACELGFEVGLFFIIGLPTDTEEDVRRSFQFALKYPVRYANFYNLVPYPGTELFEFYKEQGRLLDDPKNYLNVHTSRTDDYVVDPPGMGYEAFVQLHKEGRKVLRTVMRRHRARWLRRRLGPLGDLLAWVWMSRLGSAAIDKIKRNRVGKRLLGATYQGLRMVAGKR